MRVSSFGLFFLNFLILLFVLGLLFFLNVGVDLVFKGLGKASGLLSG